MMGAWGRFVHAHRLLVMACVLALAAVSVVVMVRGGTLSDTPDLTFESIAGADLLDDSFPAPSVVTLVFSNSNLMASDQRFVADMNTAVATLRTDHRVAMVVLPGDDPKTAAAMTSRDGHAAIVHVTLREGWTDARKDFAELRSEVASTELTVEATGTAAIQSAFDHYSQSDLQRAEFVALPAVLLLLLLVFGSVMSAFLCLVIGALAIVVGLAGVFGLSHFTSVSTYAINIVTLIGLGVAIDYSLFITSRFREELHGGASVGDALETTMATAGRAIVFSGLTVTVGLSGMLVFQGSFLVSLGIASSVVVMASVLFAVTFLPATLSLLGHRVDALRIPLPSLGSRGNMWERMANAVMRRPWMFLLPAAAALLLAGYPFAHMELVSNSVGQLPATAEARIGFNKLASDFPRAGRSQIDVVVAAPAGSGVQPPDATALRARLAAMPHVIDVEARTATSPRPLTDLVVLTDLDFQSAEARTMIDTIRADDGVAAADVYVTGNAAIDLDFVAYIRDHMFLAAAIVISATLLLLFVLLRSVVLPFKAVLMNLLSVSAAYGALVWTIQDGHLSSLLSFEAAPIDPTLPAIMFCLIFGLSMDYEVFLLSRIQESYQETGDNRTAVAHGLAVSGKLITGAAGIMVVVFAAFALASEEVVIKAVGLGIATAVLVDATLVRAIVVPALMRLLGNANWWAPAWARRRA